MATTTGCERALGRGRIALPWILAPPISSLRLLAEELFTARGSSPVSRVEADNEAVIRSLVVAGSGAALMRDDLAQEALAAGGADDGAPGLRPQYHASYYGAFVLDPDGNNVEAVCHAPEP